MTDEEEGLVLANQVAQAVERIRKAEGMTREELADRAGLHRTGLALASKGERHFTLSSAARIASALGMRLSELVAHAERELDDVADKAAPAPGPPIAVVHRPPRRTVNPDHLENEDYLRATTELGSDWIAGAIESCYDTLDIIDDQLTAKGSPPVAGLVELANLSSMIGNLLGAGLADASGGAYKRNRPHAYPDLISQRRELPPAEVKIALETNRPKGHLPKAGFYVTFRYVLADREGRYKVGKEHRGQTAWVWEVRVGELTEDDFDLSNTPGDSGKTAVIKTESFKKMTRLYFNPDLFPYARMSGPFGSAIAAEATQPYATKKRTRG